MLTGDNWKPKQSETAPRERELGINLTEQAWVSKLKNHKTLMEGIKDIQRHPAFTNPKVFLHRQADSKIYTESLKKSRQNNLERTKFKDSHQRILGIPLQFRLVELGWYF